MAVPHAWYVVYSGKTTYWVNLHCWADVTYVYGHFNQHGKITNVLWRAYMPLVLHVYNTRDNVWTSIGEPLWTPQKYKSTRYVYTCLNIYPACMAKQSVLSVRTKIATSGDLGIRVTKWYNRTIENEELIPNAWLGPQVLQTVFIGHTYWPHPLSPRAALTTHARAWLGKGCKVTNLM